MINEGLDRPRLLWDKGLVDAANWRERDMAKWKKNDWTPKSQAEIYDDITAKIVAKLETGVAPWVKPWKTDGLSGNAFPRNVVTNKFYRGINVLLLWCEQQDRGYPTADWLTSKQAKALGGYAKAGEKGTVIIKWLIKDKIDPKTGEVVVDAKGNPLKSFTLIEHKVHNVAQCEGLPARIVPVVAEMTEEQEDVEFAGWLKATGAKITHRGDSAFYRPSDDSITLPKAGKFETPSHYKATAFHELAHWTGDKSRCDRDLKGRFGDASYAAEELIAELTAAFLCAELGVDGQMRHAEYIGHWIKMMKADPSAVVTASSQASKAAIFLLEKTGKREAVEIAHAA